MMKRWLRGILLSPDVNDGGDSSDSTDVKADSSSDNKGSESGKDVKGFATIGDVAKAVFDKAVVKEKQEESSTSEKEDGSILSSNQTDESKDKEESKETEKSEADADDKEKEEVEEDGEKKEDKEHEEAVPYERFQEAVKARQTYETKLKEVEPLAEAHRSVMEFCQTNNITQEQFQEGMQMLKLLNTDPIAAKAALEPIWKSLTGLSGDVLPEDLQQEVADGLISEARAKEIAKYRGQSKVQEAQGKLAQGRQQQTQQAQFQNELNRTLGTWATEKAKVDPKFVPKTDPKTADGKFEFVADRFYRLMSSNPPKTVADAVKLVEQAYADVSTSFTSFAPKQAVSGKGLSSSKASTNSKQEPKSIADVVSNVMARHKA
jgi:hypothetical protein